MRKPGSRLDPYQAVIDAMLSGPDGAARVTIQQIYNRLVNEHQLATISYSSVRSFVHTRRQHLGLNSTTDQIR